jgi:hypothetical protein
MTEKLGEIHDINIDDDDSDDYDVDDMNDRDKG